MLFVCNGMTRSGSTLQYNLVRELVAHHQAGEAHGFFEATPNSLRGLEESWLYDDRFHVIKMHDYWSPSSTKTAQDIHAPKVARSHVYRDLRDVAASIQRKFPVTFDETVGIVEEAITTDSQIRADKTVCVQRYEDMVATPSSSCKELAQFMDLPTSHSVCQAIADSCLKQIDQSFSNFSRQKNLAHRSSYRRVRFLKRMADIVPPRLKTALKRTVFRSIYGRITKPKSQADPLTLVHPDHFSSTRGEAGAWRQCFSPEEQHVLQDRFADWLERNAYLGHQ